MDGCSEINVDLLKKFDDILKNDIRFNVLKNVVHKNGILNAIFNTQNSFKIQNIFNNEISDNLLVTNQKRSGRCWLFAGLSVLSEIISKNLKIKEIELSESYLMFYDKLEKCNTVFEYVINNINEEVDSRLFRYILNLSGENDGGFWHFFVKLVKKYGICPKDVMGETYDSSNSDKMNQIISNIVTKNIYLMRQNRSNHSELYKIKESAMADIYKILSLCIGKPVDEFSFDYEICDDKEDSGDYKNKDSKNDKNKDSDKENENLDKNKVDSDKDKNKEDSDKKNDKKKEFGSIKTTPLEFFKNYVKSDLDEYVNLVNYPSQKYKFMDTFTNKMNLNMIEPSDVKFKALNVDIDLMKESVIKSIKSNNPVWFGCDVTMNSTRRDGFLSNEIMDASSLLGIDLNYDKTARIELLNTECNHAMIFTGVHLDENNKPVRWKVQNSWGDDFGKKGFFIMTDSWFTDYVYECVIKKEFLNNDIIEAYKKDPIVLDPWNPLF